MIHISIGTANALGLKEIKTDANPTTAYFMTPGKCFFDCGYCSRAKGSPDSDRLSRVIWPTWRNEDGVFNRLDRAFKEKKLKRACIQVVNNESSFDDTIQYIKKIKRYSSIPVSVSIRTKNLEFIKKLFDAGADRVCLPIDIVDEKLHEKYRTGFLKDTLDFIEVAAKTYPGRISTHIIIGLGESEKEVVELIKKFRDLKVTVGLFAFTPIKGTKLADRGQPSLPKYRRLQIAHYLIKNDIKQEFEYNSKNEITRFDIPREKLKNSVFQTTGCPDCNRPYYNETPGGTIYNYPFPLSEEKFESVLKEAVK